MFLDKLLQIRVQLLVSCFTLLSGYGLTASRLARIITVGDRCTYTDHTSIFMVKWTHILLCIVSFTLSTLTVHLLITCTPSWLSFLVAKPWHHRMVHSFCAGVYISKISYVRRGERSLDGYYKPYHTVVYYRYLRFFPDGQYNYTCIIIHVHGDLQGCSVFTFCFDVYICNRICYNVLLQLYMYVYLLHIQKRFSSIRFQVTTPSIKSRMAVKCP